MTRTAASGRAVVSLPTDTRILIRRRFEAPPHLVYRAWTTPALIRRWWSANRGEMITVELDLRPGGRWRYAMIAQGGVEVAFHGVYREVVQNERIVATEVYEAVPDAEALDTITFAPDADGTLVTILVEHTSRAHRDAHVSSGMEAGLQDALDLLEGVALSLQ